MEAISNNGRGGRTRTDMSMVMSHVRSLFSTLPNEGYVNASGTHPMPAALSGAARRSRTCRSLRFAPDCLLHTAIQSAQLDGMSKGIAPMKRRSEARTCRIRLWGKILHGKAGLYASVAFL